MIKFFKILFLVFIKQVIFFITFCSLVNLHNDITTFIPSILLIIYMILHFWYSKKIYQKLQISKSLYNIYSYISWILVGGLITFMIDVDWFWALLPKSGGLFSGLEYAYVPLALGAYLITIILLEFIVLIICKLLKKIHS